MEVWIYDSCEVKELYLYDVGENNTTDISETFMLKFDNNGLHLAPEQIVIKHKVKYEMSRDDYYDWDKRLAKQQDIIDTAYEKKNGELLDKALFLPSRE